MGAAQRMRKHRADRRAHRMCKETGCRKRSGDASRCDEHAAEHAEAQRARRKAAREAA